jgi:hypothetical protein
MRWILVPAAAVLSVLVVGILARLVIPPLVIQPPGTPPQSVSYLHGVVLPLVFRILMGLAFVVTGAKTAPRFRPATALVLAALWIGYAFLNHVYVHLGRGPPYYTAFALAAGSAAVAAAYICYSEKSKAGRP